LYNRIETITNEYYLSGIGNPLMLKTLKVKAFLELFYEICEKNKIALEVFD
jgi:hypothetical protein